MRRPPAPPPRRLLRRLAACSGASPHAGRLLPLVSPLLFVRTRRSRGKDPLFYKARLAGSGGGAMSWSELGLDLEAWKILEFLVLELLIHQLLLHTLSGCCGSRRRGEDDHGMGKTKTCSSHMPLPRARLAAAASAACFPLAHGSATIVGLGAEEWSTSMDAASVDLSGIIKHTCSRSVSRFPVTHFWSPRSSAIT
ncbi:uncharacterized protein LOC119269118 isoform X1 [Triticum dicoccoides]|uniref:uncharacterized protein LOC119269118 isoform X1 n=1 Tax=Triticum dicoccoides TaxID=85692 RepID=UPI00188F1BCB|nr:uncharacterized protein LOC119269118 isoform X1 [Triticum dicoccoides]